MSESVFRIAISGKSGCGNTTVSKLVADTLQARFINFTFRNLATEHGISLEEVLVRAKEDDWWDKEVDTRQVALAMEASSCVLGSRLAVWMLKEADLKVYLKASAEVRAQRIHTREGGDLAAIAAFTAERDRQDRERYLQLYGIDNDQWSFVDLVVDTDTMNPEQICELVCEKLRAKLSASV
jgi:CMP/dCMP kinase